MQDFTTLELFMDGGGIIMPKRTLKLFGAAFTVSSHSKVKQTTDFKIVAGSLLKPRNGCETHLHSVVSLSRISPAVPLREQKQSR